MVSVKNIYLDAKSLPSTQVDTPDPLRNTDYDHEKLLIRWNMPKALFVEEETILLCRVRYQNRQNESISVPMLSHRGSFVYKVDAEEYKKNRGILTFCVEIKTQGKVIAKYPHFLWAEWIE